MPPSRVLCVLCPVLALDFLDCAHAVAIGAVSLTLQATGPPARPGTTAAGHRAVAALLVRTFFGHGCGYRLAQELAAGGAIDSHCSGLET
jgi:hypothetical protein